MIFNRDGQRRCPREGFGIFGTKKAFFVSTESQNSTGSLHAHLLLWISEMPTTVMECYELCTCEAFKNSMLKYVDLIVTANLPIPISECPRCEQGQVNPTDYTQRAFERPRRNSTRPVTSLCSDCGHAYGATDLIDDTLNQIVCNLSLGSQQFSEQAIFKHVATPRPLPRSCNGNLLSAVITTKALLYYQTSIRSRASKKLTERLLQGYAE